MLYLILILLALMLVLLVLALKWSSAQRQWKEEFLRELIPIREKLQATETRLGESLNFLGEESRRATQQLIDAQKTLERLSEQTRRIIEATDKMRDLFTSSRERGEMGEFLLESILASALPAHLWEKQASPWPSGERVDALVRVGKRFLPIDSKFPRESFRRFYQSGSKQDWKSLIRETKKQIDSISFKYIKQEYGTTDFAVMFLPSEAIFSLIASPKDPFGGANDLWTYALERRVLLAGPYSILAIISMATSMSEAEAMLSRVEETRRFIKNAISHSKDLENHLQRLITHLKNALNVIPDIERQNLQLRSSLEKTLKEEK